MVLGGAHRESGVPLKWLYAGTWPNQQDCEAAVHDAHEVLRPILDRMTFVGPPVTVGAIRDPVERTGATLLVVDYLQIVRPDHRQSNRRDEVDAVLTGLLTITQRFSVATLVMASVNRNQNEKARYGAGRDLGSFKESGNVEFWADSAFLLEPDEKFDDAFLEAKYVRLKLRCLKSRHDRVRHIGCTFNRPTQTFTGDDDAGTE